MVQGPTPAPPRGGAPAAAAPAAAPKPAPGDAVRRPRTDVSTAEITGATAPVDLWTDYMGKLLDRKSVV